MKVRYIPISRETRSINWSITFFSSATNTLCTSYSQHFPIIHNRQPQKQYVLALIGILRRDRLSTPMRMLIHKRHSSGNSSSSSSSNSSGNSSSLAVTHSLGLPGDKRIPFLCTCMYSVFPNACHFLFD